MPEPRLFWQTETRRSAKHSRLLPLFIWGACSCWCGRNLDYGVEQAQRARHQRAVELDQVPEARPAFHFDVVESRVVCRPKHEARRLGMTGDVLDAVELCRMIMQ